MNHYYICFFDDWVGNGVPRPDKMALQVQAEPYDLALMRRFLQLNPCMELVNVDPKVYNRAVYDGATCLSHARKEMESCGILMQLFSRFVTDECLGYCLGAAAGGKFDEIVNYIHSHLDRHIPLAELADRACLTAGHFSKVFKQVMGTSPCLYIQNRRIKRAQTLLLTTNMTITQVAERSAFTVRHSLPVCLPRLRVASRRITGASCWIVVIKCPTCGTCRDGLT